VGASGVATVAGGSGDGVAGVTAGATGPAGGGTRVAAAGAAPTAGGVSEDDVAHIVGTTVAKMADMKATLAGVQAAETSLLRPQLHLPKDVQSLGKQPMRTLEAHTLPELVYILPELAVESCELDELPVGKEATVEHRRAMLHLLQTRVASFRTFVKSPLPSLDASCGEQLATFKTLDEEQLEKALRGELASEEIT
ncbi:hypothetical protein CYMTET_25873, partial [Cymbomonas tetramitiformis]